MSGSFSVGGLASGLDTKTLIEQLMSLESQPITALQKKEQSIKDANTAFQALNTRVIALASAVSDLTLDLNIKAKSATSTDSTIVSASAGSGAASGSYGVRVVQLATASSVKATSAVGRAVTDPATALAALPSSSSFTSGNFSLHYTVNGVTSQATVNVDAANDTLQDVLDRINAATGGHVTAALGTDAKANKLVLSADSTVSNVVIGSSADTSNFLSVTSLRTQSITKTSMTSSSTVNGLIGTATLSSLGVTGSTFTLNYTNGGVAASQTLTLDPAVDTVDDLIANISAATGGAVVASVGVGANANKLILAPGTDTSAISLGGATDSSNLLATMKLTGQTVEMTATATGGLGVAQLNTALDGTGAKGWPLATMIDFDGAGNGSFTINGVTLNYSRTDTLNDVLSRINSSSAGVTAAYNTIEDRVTLTARTTGSGGITLADGTDSNLLGALGLLDAGAKTNGQNAKIGIVGINGFSAATDPDAAPGTLIESSTNVFSNVVPGLSITAVKTDSAVQTVTVASDTTTPTNKVKAFVDQYNNLVDEITKATAKGAPNAYNSDLRSMLSRIRSYLYTQVAGFDSGARSLVDLGLRTSSSDKTHLSLDEKIFRSALEANPDRVSDLFKQTTTTTLGGITKTTPVGIFAQLKGYLSSVTDSSGIFKQHDKSVANQTRLLDNQILAGNKRLDDRRASLVKQFAAMEQAVSQLKSQQSAFLSQMGSVG